MEKAILNPIVNRELEIVLETALMLAAPGTSVAAIANRIFDSERELMQQIQRPWILARLEWMLHRKKHDLPAEGQLTLPGMPRFPVRLTLKDGGRPAFMKSTFRQLKEYRGVLLKRKSPRLRLVDRLLEIMRPYAKKDRKITAQDVILKERARSARGGL